jgi:hypothetical protein
VPENLKKWSITMPNSSAILAGKQSFGVTLPIRKAPLIPVFPLAMSLGIFFVITYLLCVLFYLWFPGLVLNHIVLSTFLPGFRLLSWSSFLLGLIESFGYGAYIALVFGPIYNFFATWWH